MSTNYDNFSQTFAKSRENMKWPELEYFFSHINENDSILDIWCGSGRLLEQFKQYFWKLPQNYVWIDVSEGLLQEARNKYPNQEFICWNMIDIARLIWEQKYTNIFLIASFHHLETLDERMNCMRSLYECSPKESQIFMTHWNLNTQEKYASSRIPQTENEYGSQDYAIKIWEFKRFYHAFDLSELEYIFKKSGFEIIENRIFENNRNIVSIVRKALK